MRRTRQLQAIAWAQQTQADSASDGVSACLACWFMGLLGGSSLGTDNPQQTLDQPVTCTQRRQQAMGCVLSCLHALTWRRKRCAPCQLRCHQRCEHPRLTQQAHADSAWYHIISCMGSRACTGTETGVHMLIINRAKVQKLQSSITPAQGCCQCWRPPSPMVHLSHDLHAQGQALQSHLGSEQRTWWVHACSSKRNRSRWFRPCCRASSQACQDALQGAAAGAGSRRRRRMQPRSIRRHLKVACQSTVRHRRCKDREICACATALCSAGPARHPSACCPIARTLWRRPAAGAWPARAPWDLHGGCRRTAMPQQWRRIRRAAPAAARATARLLPIQQLPARRARRHMGRASAARCRYRLSCLAARLVAPGAAHACWGRQRTVHLALGSRRRRAGWALGRAACLPGGALVIVRAHDAASATAPRLQSHALCSSRGRSGCGGCCSEAGRRAGARVHCGRRRRAPSARSDGAARAAARGLERKHRHSRQRAGAPARAAGLPGARGRVRRPRRRLPLLHAAEPACRARARGAGVGGTSGSACRFPLRGLYGAGQRLGKGCKAWVTFELLAGLLCVLGRSSTGTAAVSGNLSCHLVVLC